MRFVAALAACCVAGHRRARGGARASLGAVAEDSAAVSGARDRVGCDGRQIRGARSWLRRPQNHADAAQRPNRARDAHYRRTTPCAAVQVFGGPWVDGAGASPPAARKRSRCFRSRPVKRGRWLSIAANAASRPACPGRVARCSSSVGPDWIGFDIVPYHEPTQVWFQNLRTGNVRTAPTLTAGTELDPDSATLTSRICAPLRQIANSSLVFFGTFAVEEVGHGHQYSEYLVRCGSNLHIKLTSPLDVYGTAPRVFGGGSSDPARWRSCARRTPAAEPRPFRDPDAVRV